MHNGVWTISNTNQGTIVASKFSPSNRRCFETAKLLHALQIKSRDDACQSTLHPVRQIRYLKDLRFDPLEEVKILHCVFVQKEVGH